ncbi:MAG: S46 family peptidase [Cyclobacteriaceae bacterium]
MRKLILSLTIIFCLPIGMTADEGMWLPSQIKQLMLYEQMKELGLELSPEDIYDINNASIKDAIVAINGGSCTGEIISPQGLMLTNHHCAYGVVQALSSVENDYLSDGFWAMSQDEEMRVEDYRVSFLIRMEDVTTRFQEAMSDDMSAQQRQAIIAELSNQIAEEAQAETGYEASVKSFYSGNEFYLFLYEVFNDVRLVGIPPESIGKFGGDTDNWMWPRHTGDFALFRVYTAPDGSPAEYSEDNVPLKPRHHLPVSLDGVQEGDFSMVFGFPGSTDRFLTSYGVEMQLDINNPTRVGIRDRRLKIIKGDMEGDPQIRIKYASKYAQVSNYWKYFIGQSQGLKNLNIVEEKQELEQKFRDWIQQKPEERTMYDTVLQNIQSAYEQVRQVQKSYIYLTEAVYGNEILPFAYKFTALERLLKQDTESEAAQAKMDELIASLQEDAKEFYEDYNAPTDRKVFAALLEMYYQNVPEAQHPDIFSRVQKKYRGSFERWAEALFQRTIFTDSTDLMNFLSDPQLKTLQRDPAYTAMQSFMNNYFEKLAPTLRDAYGDLENNNRLFVDGLREMNPDKQYYPDANSTMRLTFGTVQPYEPKDGVLYQYYTTLEGVMEKKDPDDAEFQVPDKLVELYEEKNYGPYGLDDNTMPVNFISNNDITGGNSGSPVINGKGYLIGTAFDGNWEAMSGDIAFEDKMQRTISVDIRYTLFIIDKFAGAGHLVEEMTLVQNGMMERETNESPAPEEESGGN